MDRLEGIKIFVRVVDSGSFSAVARELGTGQPAISKQVAALEEYLGAQLLVRTSRSLSVTEAGRGKCQGSGASDMCRSVSGKSARAGFPGTIGQR